MPNKDRAAARRALGHAAAGVTGRARRADADPVTAHARRLEAWVKEMHEADLDPVPLASLDASKQHPAATPVVTADGEERYIRLGINGPMQWLLGPEDLVLTTEHPLALFPAPDDPELLAYCRVAATVLAAADGVSVPLARALQAGGKLTAARWLLEHSDTTWDPVTVGLAMPSPRRILEHALAGRKWEMAVFRACCVDVFHWDQPEGTKLVPIPEG